MRGCTGQRSEIMSAFRGLRSSEGHHGAPGRSLLTRSGPHILRCGGSVLSYKSIKTEEQRKG